MTPNHTPFEIGDRVQIRADAAAQGLAPSWAAATAATVLSMTAGTATVLSIIGDHVQVAFDLWVTDSARAQIVPWLNHVALEPADE